MAADVALPTGRGKSAYAWARHMRALVENAELKNEPVRR